MDIGTEILKQRKRKGLTQTEVAKLSGFSRVSVYRVEEGITKSLGVVSGVAKALGLNVKAIVTQELDQNFVKFTIEIGHLGYNLIWTTIDQYARREIQTRSTLSLLNGEEFDVAAYINSLIHGYYTNGMTWWVQLPDTTLKGNCDSHTRDTWNLLK